MTPTTDEWRKYMEDTIALITGGHNLAQECPCWFCGRKPEDRPKETGFYTPDKEG